MGEEWGAARQCEVVPAGHAALAGGRTMHGAAMGVMLFNEKKPVKPTRSPHAWHTSSSALYASLAWPGGAA